MCEVLASLLTMGVQRDTPRRCRPGLAATAEQLGLLLLRRVERWFCVFEGQRARPASR